MIKSILSKKDLSLKRRLKNALLYVSRKRGAKRSWDRRHSTVLNRNQDLKKECSPEVEKKHCQLWSDFRSNPDLTTLRICKNISGHADPRIIPEDIFISDIEPTLMTDESVHFLSHKSFYNRWFPDGIFPKDILHCIDGQYLDSDLGPITLNEFTKQAQNVSYPVVMKPNRDSFGGKDVFFIEKFENLIRFCKKSDDFVIQEQILQHEYFNKFNPIGLNTIRVYIYKSLKDNSYHILNMALRMGKGGSLDNETSGGIHTMINKDGFLNNYAVNKYGKRYEKHPDTGYTFNSKIPAYEKLKELSLKIGEQVFFSRIIGLDACFDKDSNWRIIEVNTKGHTIRFSQYGGQPFFGNFTDEVIEYCKQNHWALQ